MARPELGTKRVCPTTGRKFYDLNKDPIVSPYTGQVVPITMAASARGRLEVARSVEAEDDTEADAATEPELISLEDADEEASASKTATTDDTDADADEDDDNTADDTFLEEEEDEDDDVTDLIGDGIDEEEER